MTDEAKTPGADAAADGETPPIIDFYADMPGVGDHVKDAYEKEQNRVGADAEDKTPANEGFADKIRRIIEDDENETSPDSAADPWAAGEDLTPAEVPLTPPREFYENIPIKEIPELDTYEELATQWDAVGRESSDLTMERAERAHADYFEKQAEDLRDMGEDVKDTPIVGDALAGAYEQAAEELEAETQRPPVDLSTMNEVYKDGVTPDPQIADKVRGHFEGHEGPGQGQPDTYEHLEADYKDALWARDQELMKNYESQQREAVEDAVEDVGEAAAGSVEDHPLLGDVMQSIAEQAEIDEANIEIHSPENDPGMVE